MLLGNPCTSEGRRILRMGKEITRCMYMLKKEVGSFFAY